MDSKLLNFGTTGTGVFSRGRRRTGRLPLQMPLSAEGLAPKLHSSPLVWSQGCVRLQSSFSCLAQTLQQPQPSGTSPTPGAHCGTAAGHWHTAGQGEPRACGAERRSVSAGSRAERSPRPPTPCGQSRGTYQARQAEESGRQSGAGARGAHVQCGAGAASAAGPARSEAAAGATALYGARGRRVRRGADVARSGPRPHPALAASQECGWRARPPRPAPSRLPAPRPLAELELDWSWSCRGGSPRPAGPARGAGGAGVGPAPPAGRTPGARPSARRLFPATRGAFPAIPAGAPEHEDVRTRSFPHAARCR